MTKLKEKSNKLLEMVRRGRRPGADRVVGYGPEGVGKTTFASQAPEPVFIAPEDGTRHLDRGASFPAPRTYGECLDQINAVIEGDHNYETLVIDTLDWFEKLIITHVCKENEWADIEEPDWGKGYNHVAREWMNVIALLDRVRERGIQIILLAHSDIKLFNSPDEKGYSRFNLMMSKRGAAVVKQWADSVLFMRFEVHTSTGKDKRTQGFSSGKRIIHTQWDAAYDAKNRCGLPTEISLDWSEYEAARDSGGGVAAARLREQCMKLIDSLKDAEKAEKATKYIADMGEDPVKLTKGLDWLRSHAEQEVEVDD